MPLRIKPTIKISCVLMTLLLAACGSGERYSPKGGSQDPVRIKIGKPYSIKGIRYYPKYDANYNEDGLASWYGPGFHGRQTASGEQYDQNEMTAAHTTLPMPSIVKVTHRNTGKQIIVRINDRGPFASGRIIDLSKRAAQELGTIGEGVAPVTVEYLPHATQRYLVDVGIPVPDAWRTDTAYAQNEFTLVDDVLPAVNAEDAGPVREAYDRFENPQPMPTQIDAILDAPIQPPSETAYKEDAFSVIDDSGEVPKLRPEPLSNKRLYYIQVGTFGSKINANKLADKLARFAATDIQRVASAEAKTLYKVRLGPTHSPATADNIYMRVISLGFDDAYIVNE